MRLLVLSDSHGNCRAVRRALEAQSDVRHVVFLGDGLREIEDVADEEPGRVFYTVPGNCDFGATALPVREETFGGMRVMFTHGHLHRVKYGLEPLCVAAQARQAGLVLFGHTHQPLFRYEEGLYLVNPGSVGKDGRYAVVDIVSGGVMANLLQV